MTRQKQLEQAVLRVLDELGDQTTTEFLIAVASERTQADPVRSSKLFWPFMVETMAAVSELKTLRWP
jgi:hypothetical protein